MQRASLVNLGDLTTYDMVKHTLLRHTSVCMQKWRGSSTPMMCRAAGGQLSDARHVQHLCRSRSRHAGYAAIVIQRITNTDIYTYTGTPADVIKTRIMNDHAHYASSWDCLKKTVCLCVSRKQPLLTHVPRCSTKA